MYFWVQLEWIQKQIVCILIAYKETHVKLFIKLCVCGVPWGTLNHLCSLLSFFSGYFSKGLYRLDDFQNIRGFEVWITVIATMLKRTNKNNFGSQSNPRLESISSNLEVVRRCSKYQSTPSQSYWKKSFTWIGVWGVQHQPLINNTEPEVRLKKSVNLQHLYHIKLE